MIAALILVLQAAGAAMSPLPPQDWSTLPPLHYAREPVDDATLSGFVRSEVRAGRCAAATASSYGWTLRVELAVLIGSGGQPRRVVPRAINCPAVEQYAVGLITSMTRGNVVPDPGSAGDGWYRTSLSFSWPA